MKLNVKYFAAGMLLVSLLEGCAAAPGMSMKSLPPDSVVRPVVIEVTPSLIRTERETLEKRVAQDLSDLIKDPVPYQIGVGDVVSVNVLGQTEVPSVSVMMAPISNNNADSISMTGFTVDPNGELHLPYLDPVPASGLTEHELHLKLTQLYGKIIKKPDLSVRIISYRSKRVFMDGELKTPGVLPIVDIPMSLSEALGRAGGATASGDIGAIQIVRGTKNFKINVPYLVSHGQSPSKLLLQHGDIVRVPHREDSKIFVLGEVNKPSTLMMRNGRMTLNEAIGDAGGVNLSSGDGGQIYVIRNAEDMKPNVYHLDASSPVALALAENFDLLPKDVVYVDSSSLARWNRIVNLILPTAQLVVNSKYLNLIK